MSGGAKGDGASGASGGERGRPWFVGAERGDHGASSGPSEATRHLLFLTLELVAYCSIAPSLRSAVLTGPPSAKRFSFRSFMASRRSRSFCAYRSFFSSSIHASRFSSIAARCVRYTRCSFVAAMDRPRSSSRARRASSLARSRRWTSRSASRFWARYLRGAR